MYNNHNDKVTERTDFLTDSVLEDLKMECELTVNPWVKLWRQDYINSYDKEEHVKRNYYHEYVEYTHNPVIDDEEDWEEYQRGWTRYWNEIRRKRDEKDV